MSGPMVRAVLDGRKMQTRRVMKPQPVRLTDVPGECESAWTWNEKVETYESGFRDLLRAHCPYGQPGDRLWVRETFIAATGVGGYAPGVDPDKTPLGPTINVIYRADDGPNERTAKGWKPSIFMPRQLSRLTLEITGVRVERLSAISEDDAINEGCEPTSLPCVDGEGEWSSRRIGARVHYATLWDSLNAKRGFGWDVNPWVWVIVFRKVTS